MRRSAILVLAACTRCAPEDPPAEDAVLDEGEHVVVLSEPGLELCSGSMAHMDAFVERAAMEFGLDPPRGDERVRFHWLTEDAIEEACGGAVLGCAPGGEIFAIHAPLDHELVHAVVAPLGLPRPLFAEGLAVMYEDIGRGPLSPYFVGGSTDVLALVELDQVEFSRQGAYRLAGAFTAFLIDRFGIRDYLRAYSAIGRDADRHAVDRVFREVFAVSLEQSVADFEALRSDLGDRCDQPAFGAKLVECSAPEIAWDGELLAVERTLACDQTGSIGPFDDKVLVLHTITVPAQGVYELRMEGDAQEAESMPDFALGDQAVTGVSLRRCGGCETPGWMATWSGSTPRLAELPAGRYSLRLHGPADRSVALGFTFVRVPDAIAPGG